MSQLNRTKLKSYFETGQRPTKEQFADLIDSGLNLTDDGIFDDGGNLGLGHNSPVSKLSVNGNVTVSPNNDSAPDNGLFVHGKVGIGAGFTRPTAHLAVKGSVYIGNTESTDPGTNSLKVDGNIKTEGNLSITGTLHAVGDTTMDGNLALAGAKHVATDELRARDSGGLKLYEDSGAHGLMIQDSGNVSIGGTVDTHRLHVDGTLHAVGDTTMGGNLTLADTKYVATDELRARDSGGLKLYEDSGANGLTIHDSGNVSIGGTADTHKLHVDGTLHVGGETRIDSNLTLANNQHIAADEVRAKDNGGLKLYEAGGAHGVMIHDNGNVSIGGTADTDKLHVDGSLGVTGNIEASSLSLTGDSSETDFQGYHEGSEYGSYTVNVPDNKVVVGLIAKRYRRGHGDKDFYTFALKYK